MVYVDSTGKYIYRATYIYYNTLLIIRWKII